MDFGKDYRFTTPITRITQSQSHYRDDCDKIVEFESDRLDQLENEISTGLGSKLNPNNFGSILPAKMKRLGECKNKVISPPTPSSNKLKLSIDTDTESQYRGRAH